jgi:hypothetical protein
MSVRKKSLVASRTTQRRDFRTSSRYTESQGETRPARASFIRLTALKKSGESVTLYRSGKN